MVSLQKFINIMSEKVTIIPSAHLQSWTRGFSSSLVDLEFHETSHQSFGSRNYGQLKDRFLYGVAGCGIVWKLYQQVNDMPMP
jgi:hypothetical protein